MPFYRRARIFVEIGMPFERVGADELGGRNRRQQRSILSLLPPVVDFKLRHYREFPFAAHAEARSGRLLDHVTM